MKEVSRKWNRASVFAIICLGICLLPTRTMGSIYENEIIPFDEANIPSMETSETDPIPVSPVIIVGETEVDQEEIIETHAEIEEQVSQEQREAYINSITFNPSDVTQITNLTLEDMKYLTEGTWWSGHEDTLYDLEQNHHVNAAFAMAVSSLESACGTSARARNRHNYYGLSTSTVYDGIYGCTMYFGDLINRLYINQGRSSVWTIGPKYCPPNRKWETYMNDYMTKARSKVIPNLTV